MSIVQEAIRFYLENTARFQTCLVQHLKLSLICIAICLVVGIPVGYISAKNEKIATPVITGINALCTIPVVAMFFILIPLLGLGVVPAVIVICIHSILTMIINTIAGIRNISPGVLESARAMGYDRVRICFSIELPLALPVILNGLRTAAVGVISGATLAAYISAGGLGELVLAGIASMKYGQLLLSGGAVVIMVLVFDGAIMIVQRALTGYLR